MKLNFLRQAKTISLTNGNVSEAEWEKEAE